MTSSATHAPRAAPAAAARTLELLALTIALAPGESYVGAIVGEDGPAHHVILLPGEHRGTWDEALAWAESIGGELPTRREQALLFANAQDEFQEDWYWSSEQHAEAAGVAWVAYFGAVYQYCLHESGRCRTRAVRRVIIGGE